MAYIEPNSIIVLCKNVPLDNTYEHTLYFDNAGLQASYFRNKAKYTFENQTYQRVVRGKMRLQKCADDIYDCNYLMYQNTNYGTKWFYAFITGIEYINNITSEITFEIDSMQTYFFDVELKECFVEREHVSDDAVGLHTLPENVNCGEMIPQVSYDYMFGSNLEEMRWRVKLKFRPNDFMTTLDYFFGGNPITFQENQLTMPEKVYDWDDTDGIMAGLTVQSVAGSDVDLTMYPQIFDISSPPSTQLPLHQHDIKRPTVFQAEDIQGEKIYRPKNNKLFTFPYTYLLADNNEGGQIIYKWEDMGENPAEYCNFYLSHNTTNEIACWIEKRDYQNGMINPNRLWITGFPKVTLFEPEIGKNLTQLVTSLGKSALSSCVPVTAATDEALKIADKMSTIQSNVEIGQIGLNGLANAMYEPSKQVGAISNNTKMKYNKIGYSFYVMCIKPEYAHMIDNYFQIRGYACQQVKVPNRAVRRHWTYTKTKGCIVIGNAPADDVRKICQIYDHGVTFWRSPEYVGNYSLDNPTI